MRPSSDYWNGSSDKDSRREFEQGDEIDVSYLTVLSPARPAVGR
jgi:hypothetical protein